MYGIFFDVWQFFPEQQGETLGIWLNEGVVKGNLVFYSAFCIII